MSGLYPNTTYYVRAYATNSQGTGYGNELSFITLSSAGTVTDIDGNVYATVEIGDQTWMAEDLKVTRYADGSSLDLVESSAGWVALDLSNRAYCWYNNNSDNGDTYGALYSYSAATNDSSSVLYPSGVQGVCPGGWHLPSDAEWQHLEIYLGISPSEADSFYWRGTTEGGMLKESGSTHWISPNTGATNESGFTALPGGRLEPEGAFHEMGYYAWYWTTSGNIYNGLLRNLDYNRSVIYRSYATSTYGFSVRCVKNKPPPSLPSVTTATVTGVTQSGAESGGNVTDDGGGFVIAKGVCWSTSQNPTPDDFSTKDASGTGSYTSNITGLDCNTTYYVRAYAVNSAGTAYGGQEEFTTTECSSEVLPTVTTSPVTSVTDVTATGGGEVTENGGGTVSAKGVCWSTESEPTLSDDFTSDGTGTGVFTSNLSGLTKSTTYYVRAYATNLAGTAYGEEVTFRTYEGTVSDYNGNNYWTVKIGDQVWMAQNLKTTRYADGSDIPLVEGGTAWDALVAPDKGYCWYENMTSHRDTYGGLYNWAAAMNGAAGSDANPSGIQGACPDGWHLPSDAEWTVLSDYLGGGGVAGGKMKEAGTVLWDSPNTGATNESGFSALPAGHA